MLQQNIRAQATQQLQITPKLQQAINFLQLSTQELTAELQQIMLSNVFLEYADNIDSPESELDQDDLQDTFDQNSMIETACDIEGKEIEIDKQSLYEEFLPQYLGNQDKPNFLDYYAEPTDSLKNHLTWQLTLSPLTQQQQKIGEIIIDSINEDGYLELSCKEIKQILKESDERVNLGQIESVLAFIQSFDPIGVGARNLQESLLIQLDHLAPATPNKALAKKIISQQIEWLAAHKYAQLRRLYAVTQQELEETVALIKSLNPRPGIAFRCVEKNYIIPDVTVERVNDHWQVALNAGVAPKLQLNYSYIDLLETKADDNSKQFIHHHKQEAHWLMKCLRTRNETLLKVAACIVEHQRAFFEHGAAGMKPLTLQKIAENLGLHQSTISRITTKKYLQTPHGTFELKHFFTACLTTEYGEKCSAMAMQSYIQNIIKKEEGCKPCSDSLIAKKLKSFGINIARRTVTKYREQLKIPPTYLRKTV